MPLQSAKKGVLVPKRKLELPRSVARRRLPDARFPHIWVPRIIPVRAAVALDATCTTAIDNQTSTNPFNAVINLTVGAGACYAKPSVAEIAPSRDAT